MFSDEIVDLCISNAETYYNYLKEHKEDSQRRIGVKKIVCSEDRSSNIELHLKERLYNTEDLLFSVGDALYTSSEIRPVNYSNTCKILYISPKDELKSVLLNCAVGECFILSDTLYLIKRFGVHIHRMRFSKCRKCEQNQNCCNRLQIQTSTFAK